MPDNEETQQTQETQTQGEDTTALRNALQAERTRANALQGEVQTLKQTYEGIDAAAAKEAIAQLPQLQQELNATKIETAAAEVLGQVLPQYRDLFRSSVRSQLQVNDQGQVVTGDGRSLSDVAAGLKTQYPNMFAADNVPTGSGMTTAAPSPSPSPASVGTQNGVITGVDPADVLAGKVQITG